MNETNNVFQRDYFGETTIAPMGLVAIIILGAAMLIVPRKYAVWPMLVMACFVPPAQRVAVFSLNFDLLRIMVLFASVRIFLRGEWRGFKRSVLDYLVIAWCLYGLFTFTLLFFSVEALKYRFGSTYDAIGMYFLFRIVIREWSDVDEICRAIAVLSLPVLAAFLLENATGRNIFAFMGGVPDITDIRDGRLRCQGAFAHPILAGCFWATGVPMLAAELWRKGISRWLSICGIVASVGIVVLCASSTPVSALIVSVPAMLAFLARRYVKAMLWCLAGLTVALQLCMNHPLWWLFTYVDVVGGSTSWFRYILMQAAFDHLYEWWLIGSALGSAHWGDGLVDVTNNYIVQGLHGGIGLLTLFLGIFVSGFALVGKALNDAAMDRSRAIMSWAIGVALLMHAANFLGIAYFGQIQVMWYMQLGIIGSLATLNVVPFHGRIGMAALPSIGAPCPAVVQSRRLPMFGAR